MTSILHVHVQYAVSSTLYVCTQNTLLTKRGLRMSHARTTHVSRLSHRPPATFPSVFADRGAITSKSAHRRRSMCNTGSPMAFHACHSSSSPADVCYCTSSVSMHLLRCSTCPQHAQHTHNTLTTHNTHTTHSQHTYQAHHIPTHLVFLERQIAMPTWWPPL